MSLLVLLVVIYLLWQDSRYRKVARVDRDHKLQLFEDMSVSLMRIAEEVETIRLNQ